MDGIRALELYSGIGGMHFALRDCCPAAKIVAAMDINDHVTQVYAHNFPDVKVKNKGIEGISVKELDNFGFNMVLMSPPCQPFTRIGLQKDINDKRIKSFLHFLSILPKLQKGPKYLLLENVKGFEKSMAHEELCKTLDVCGYYKTEFLLSPKHLGIPNSRLRYFMLAKKSKFHHLVSRNDEELWTTLPLSLTEVQNCNRENTEEAIKAKFPKMDDQVRVQKTCISHPISEFLEKDVPEDYKVPDKVKSRYINVMDIVPPESKISTCFTKSYTQYAEGTGSALVLKAPPNHSENKSARNANDYDLRYFTPREVANLMCFPDSFMFPDSVTRKQRYRMLGNSLNVKVVSYLISLLLLDGDMKSS